MLTFGKVGFNLASNSIFLSKATLNGQYYDQMIIDFNKKIITYVNGTDSRNAPLEDAIYNIIDDKLGFSSLKDFLEQSVDMNEDQLRIFKIGIGAISMMLKKNRDYGSSVWKKPILAPQIDGGTQILVRMSDKISRLETLLNGHVPLIAESLEDTLFDLFAYILLYLARPK